MPQRSAVQLQDGAARGHLEGGDAPAVKDDEPIAVPADADGGVVEQMRVGLEARLSELERQASKLLRGDAP